MAHGEGAPAGEPGFGHEEGRSSSGRGLAGQVGTQARAVVAAVLDTLSDRLARSRPRTVMVGGMAVGAALAVAVVLVGRLGGGGSGGSGRSNGVIVKALPRASGAPAAPSSARVGAVSPGSGAGVGTGTVGVTSGAEARELPTTLPADLVVHAAGAVLRAGVVRVPSGSRVADVIAAAGGPTADADIEQVNLAASVLDGQRVVVPRRGTTAVPTVVEVNPPVAPGIVLGGTIPVVGGQTGGDGAGSAIGVVNINTATVTQLDELPGVGPATAAAIVEYRSAKGPFRSVEQLIDVPGIGEAKLAALRKRATV
jgi:competence protein ComEA